MIELPTEGVCQCGRPRIASMDVCRGCIDDAHGPGQRFTEGRFRTDHKGVLMAHGTWAAARWHRASGVPLCEPCKTAERDRNRS